MKIKFKVQDYQTRAVKAVVDCFKGQPYLTPFSYLVDPGKIQIASNQAKLGFDYESGFKNQPIQLNEYELLKNIQQVQRAENLFISENLTTYKDAKGKLKPKSYNPGALLNLDIEMETGTGKTYCYAKTIFELNKHYGWCKFIIIVPSIAIREGVYTSLKQTAEHFAENYQKKAKFFIYDSARLHEIESFSSDNAINIMIMNIQSFNAPPKENAAESTKLSIKNRIYRELDTFNSRKPIEVIAANKPILILDEPQRLEGKATLEALPYFKPLFIMRYSATHNTQHNLIHRLDAIDAYNHKLVKKVEVRGIKTQGIAGTDAYLYLQEIEISKQAPVARLDMQVQTAGDQIGRKIRRIKKGDNLFTMSGNLEAYHDRYVVTQIDARHDTIEFENGLVLKAGDVYGDLTERQLRRIQIRETIAAHLHKERALFKQGIKVLSLFFIDTVAKYRDYEQTDAKGEYARIFEEEYQDAVNNILSELDLENNVGYRTYLEQKLPEQVHKGYFSIDKNKKLVDPKLVKTTLTTDDISAYDLIMRDKERLLSFAEPTRFIFSHSALREGWDNPNIFVLCMLKAADPEKITTRRQEVGRGLRIAVNTDGVRMDDPATVHDINVLTVVANESFSDFASAMQKEMLENLAARPRKADVFFFKDKQIVLNTGETITLTGQEASSIIGYLYDSDYIDEHGYLTDEYHQDRKSDELELLPKKLREIGPQILELVDSLLTEESLPKIDNARAKKQNNLNRLNFDNEQFKELWQRINQKAIYKVDFDSHSLVDYAVHYINKNLNVRRLTYKVESGVQSENMSRQGLVAGDEFLLKDVITQLHTEKKSVLTNVTYDLIGKVAENTELTRHTIASILSKISKDKFAQYEINPEHFISETSRLIKECKAESLKGCISYHLINETHDKDEIFSDPAPDADFSLATKELKKSVYYYVITDSKVESEFAKQLEVNRNVEVYAKLPKKFTIPTPVGNYNPDWAIAFVDGAVKHIYFVAETKGDSAKSELRDIEKNKIDCARKFFEALAEKQPTDTIKYDVVSTFEELMVKIS